MSTHLKAVAAPSPRARHADIPVVFVSSTDKDLTKYRESAREAALSANFQPRMMESFTVTGARRPLAECQARVAESDVVVVLVAHRYGWVPPDQPGDEHKSITWLECEEAVRCGLEVLAFVLHDAFVWPAEDREEHELVLAVREGRGTPELMNRVQRSVARLADFKKWLNDRGIRALFTTPEDLRGKISDALRDWRARHAEFALPGLRHSELRGMEAETFMVQQQIVQEYARRFVGREDVEQALDRFLAKEPRGYFLVRGEPGQGKTAFASHVVKSRGLVHHFVSRTGGRSDARLILRALVAQLIPRAEVDLAVPDTLPDLNKCLEDVLARLTARQKGHIVVIDAVDELPDESYDALSFLFSQGLPDGAYFVVTTRPGERLDRLVKTLRHLGVPHEECHLGPLSLPEMEAILHARQIQLSATDVERIAEASQGNPLYLTAVIDELGKNPAFDLRELPAAIEGFFQRSIGDIRERANNLRLSVLGLLTVARKPLSLRDLSQITGVKQRQVDDQAIRPIQQFLFQVGGGFSFYHARFRDYVTRELLYEDELPECHRLLAEWLQRSENQGNAYRWTSLAHHLFEAGDFAGLAAAIDQEFLKAKVAQFGYAVLEDVELLSRAMLDRGDPALVARCVALVEGLRAAVGGDLIDDTRRAMQAYRPGPESFRSRVQAPRVPVIPGLEVYVGMLPKVEVGADFFEVVPAGGKLVLAIGDAPGKGLKGAFVARFIGNLFRRLLLKGSLERAGDIALGEALAEINRVISAHEYFEWVTMQCAVINLRDGIVSFANAGHPYPVLYSARRGRCDQLPIRGDPLHSEQEAQAAPARYEVRRAEIGAGDVLVLLTDGLTEGHRLTDDRYGYRFTQVLEKTAPQGARAIGEAILDDWRAHPHESDYADDVTVVVVAVNH